ncbi:MAG TPA: 30S ribosomal protein S17 [Thermoanaerobaculia bacterium]|nr:30S ribosomal protein S17 [Thermoanaerobaculia bacterium]
MAIGDTTSEGTIESGERRGKAQVKVGTVVSDRMDKTVVVEVEGKSTHRLYHRQVKRTKRFAAHDERNEAKVGDRVVLESTRPLSKSKRWRVREILRRSVEVEP